MALSLIWLLGRSFVSRAVPGWSSELACAQALFRAGQVSELLVVAHHHGPEAGAEALLDPSHDAALLLTGPGLLASGAALVGLAVSVLLAARRTDGEVPGAARIDATR